MGIPRTSAEAKVHKFRFLDTHLYRDNEYAFHALAFNRNAGFRCDILDRTVKTGEAGGAFAEGGASWIGSPPGVPTA